MENLSRSVFYRIRESSEGKDKRFEPDTPLVLFILFSRIATGFAFAAGLLYFKDNPLSFYLVLCAFFAMVLATVTSLTHLSTPFRFYRVLKNPSSHLTLEIAFSSVFLTVLVLIIGKEIVPVKDFEKISGLFLFLTAILLLLGTTYAYKYTAHPLWNSMRPFPYYLTNGLAFASFFLDLAFTLKGTETGLYCTAFGFIFIVIQCLFAGFYILFLKNSSPEAVMYVRRKKTRLLLTWIVCAFIMPALFSLMALLTGGSKSYLTIIITASMVLGCYAERILFFVLEKPVFFFNTELKKPGTASRA